MGENSSVSWTAHSFNAWIGCEKIAPGCTNCYAAALETRYNVNWGSEQAGGTRRTTTPKYWTEPLKWNRKAALRDDRPCVFVNSLSDIFEDWNGLILNHHGEPLFCDDRTLQAPYLTRSEASILLYPLTMASLRRDLFRLIDATPYLTWVLLTKRPENICRLWPARNTLESDLADYWLHGWPISGGPTFDATIAHWRHRDICQPSPWIPEWCRDFRLNVRIGTSISDQATADKNIPALLQARNKAPVLFLSAEPLLDAVNLAPWLRNVPRCEVCGKALKHVTEDLKPASGEKQTHFARVWPCPEHDDKGQLAPRPSGIGWVIVGGESGPGYRRMPLEPLHDIARDCQEAEVPLYVKQDSGPDNETQGGIPDYLWSRKQHPIQN